MREPIKDRGRLEHILQNDRLLYYALVKNVEIIGEAAYMLTEDFRSTHSDTNWRDIISMRHVLVHGYYAVSPGHVWSVIERDIQPLKEKIEIYLSQM